MHYLWKFYNYSQNSWKFLDVWCSVCFTWNSFISDCCRTFFQNIRNFYDCFETSLHFQKFWVPFCLFQPIQTILIVQNMHSELLCLLYLSFVIVHIISKKIKTSLTLKCFRNCGLPFGTFMFVSQSAEYLKKYRGSVWLFKHWRMCRTSRFVLKISSIFRSFQSVPELYVKHLVTIFYCCKTSVMLQWFQTL